jgi:hypothetical protein
MRAGARQGRARSLGRHRNRLGPASAVVVRRARPLLDSPRLPGIPADAARRRDVGRRHDPRSVIGAGGVHESGRRPLVPVSDPHRRSRVELRFRGRPGDEVGLGPPAEHDRAARHARGWDRRLGGNLQHLLLGRPALRDHRCPLHAVPAVSSPRRCSRSMPTSSARSTPPRRSQQVDPDPLGGHARGADDHELVPPRRRQRSRDG